VRETVQRFDRLDAAYNNAGVQNVLAETADTTRDDYERSDCIVNCSSLGGARGPCRRDRECCAVALQRASRGGSRGGASVACRRQGRR
jgi:hypothetical protein